METLDSLEGATISNSPSTVRDQGRQGGRELVLSRESQKKAAAGKHRFICFIGDPKLRTPHVVWFLSVLGNIPFSATTKSLTDHFKSVQPTSIRHPTDKSTGKSRGFAFLEFDTYACMQRCIKNFHHSNLPDGRDGVRKINVELTVGGGGTKSELRMKKLKAKNKRLDSERKKQVKERMKLLPGAEGKEPSQALHTTIWKFTQIEGIGLLLDVSARDPSTVKTNPVPAVPVDKLSEHQVQTRIHILE